MKAYINMIVKKRCSVKSVSSYGSNWIRWFIWQDIKCSEVESIGQENKPTWSRRHREKTSPYTGVSGLFTGSTDKASVLRGLLPFPPCKLATHPHWLHWSFLSTYWKCDDLSFKIQENQRALEAPTQPLKKNPVTHRHSFNPTFWHFQKYTFCIKWLKRASCRGKHPFIQVLLLQIMCPLLMNVLLDGESLRLMRNVTISLILPYLGSLF